MTRRQYQQQPQQQQRTYQSRGQQQQFNQQHHQHQHRIATNSASSSNHRQHLSHHQTSHQIRSRESGCSLTICYSYLIAIFSSFLVVLGIYLSVTKFNARFLYLSLAGLLIEALGACLYCMSNIHKSKLAQYKQTVEDFNLENNPGSNITSAAAIPGNGQRQSLTRHQQARSVTHILTNRTLNQAAIPTDNITSSNNGNNIPANNIDEQPNSCEPLPANDNLTSNRETGYSQCDNHADNQSVATNSSTGALLHQDPRPEVVEATNIASNSNIQERLPNSDSETCRDGATIQVNIPATSQPLKLPEQKHSQQGPSHDSIHNSHGVSEPRQLETAAQYDDVLPTPPSTSDPIRQAPAIDETDLTCGQTMAPPNLFHHAAITDQAKDVSRTARGSSTSPTSSQDSTAAVSNVPTAAAPSGRSRATRHPNVRRTLVMGLSGEEEMIEIDEADLDNMSILPPSYESIVTADGGSEPQPQSQPQQLQQSREQG